MVIKRIGVLKLGIFQGCMGVLFGLLAGVIVMLFGSMIGQASGSASLGMLGGAAALIMLPIIYGIGMFIAGIIGAAIYNLVANLVGGVEIDVT